MPRWRVADLNIEGSLAHLKLCLTSEKELRIRKWVGLTEEGNR